MAKKERKAGTAEKWECLGPASLFQAFIQWREAQRKLRCMLEGDERILGAEKTKRNPGRADCGPLALLFTRLTIFFARLG